LLQIARLASRRPRLARRATAKGHFTTRKHGLIGAATDQFLQWQLIFFCGGMRKYGIMEQVAIAVTAVVGLIAFPLLQPAWVMVKQQRRQGKRHLDRYIGTDSSLPQLS
jgi:hypothetical protein